MHKGRRAPPGVKGPDVKRHKQSMAPTVQEIVEDELTPLANAYWSTKTEGLKPFNAKIIDEVYANELAGKPIINDRVTLLELSGYLENYLWKHFDDKTSTFAHVMSILLLVNEKFNQNLLDIWEPFHTREEQFVPFLQRVWTLKKDHDLTQREKTAYLIFLIHAFQSLEDPTVRSSCLRLTSPVLWQTLAPAMLKKQIKVFPGYKRFLKKLLKKGSAELETNFLPDLLDDFVATLQCVTRDSDFAGEETQLRIRYCERFLEFIVDLMAQLPTRRFFHAVLVDKQFPVLCEMSELNRMSKGEEAPGKLFSQLFERLKHYLYFEIDDQTGNALTESEMLSQHYEKIAKLQNVCFKHMRSDLGELAALNVASIDQRKTMLEHLSQLPAARLRLLAEKLGLLSEQAEGGADMSKKLLVEILIFYHERRTSQKQQVKALPLYPTEAILWDEGKVPSQNYTGEGCLALPKLNLQFLTMYDYLLRNFNLYRLESTYEIREDVSRTVFGLKPRLSGQGETVFTGHARMAIPIYTFSVTQVRKPNIGDAKPALVKAEVTVDLSPFNRSNVRDEWEALREHDCLFLLTVQARAQMNDKMWNEKQGIDWEKINKESLGIVTVRGCELVRVLDEDKKVVGERDEHGNAHIARGNMRTYQVELDCAQYQEDMTGVVQDNAEDPYTTFNLLLRRKPKENNFRAVLATIRDLMSDDCLIPEWLHDVFLGYGNAQGAQYHSLPQQLQTIGFRDTFQDEQHIRDSHAEGIELVATETDGATFFDLTYPLGVAPDHTELQQLKPAAEREAIPKRAAAAEKEEKGDAMMDEEEVRKAIQVRPTSRPKVWGQTSVKRNLVRFTPMQVEAIKSGINPGLTMIVGPPGTGKTDTAVQIISEMYHNFPDQRILLVTHSNHALNDLFEKIMERDIDQRYLLRLGRGQDFLETEEDFSKFGRVNHMLNRRMTLLAEVQTLAEAMSIQDDFGSTCETAKNFFRYHVLAGWEEFKQKRAAAGKAGEALNLTAIFPFTTFFQQLDPSKVLFSGDAGVDAETVESCWRYIEMKFEELQECAPFERLRTGRDRGTHLLTKHAKIIAMTCTHAAINRPNFIKWGFQYDNIIMEEAAQILEIETFVPMMLQVDDKEFGNRLKRVVLLGDHHQLPPVIKNRAFQKFCHMDQSLFTRFVRLGMPYIQLNAQGRMRSSLAKLWNWKYENLRDLPTVTHTPRFQQANAGLRHEFQLVDVGDYFGQGENSPQPNFVQNLAEAEYVVRTYMYMRLIGYPAEKISIITTYNGQKSLIRDVVARHCLNDPLFGAPAKITTVDKFQGQQNDFVLLSLVRTKLAGHIRDVRRLVVSMSRARLGLYVFCRKELYLNCYELASTFNVLTSKPSQLQLMPKERSTDGLSTERGVDTAVPEAEVTTVRDVEHMMGVVDELKNSIKAEWGLYHERVSAYEQKQREAAETRSRREQKAAEERRQSAVEEQEQQRKEAKAAEYDTQTEDFMEKTAQRVEQVEKQAMEEEDA